MESRVRQEAYDYFSDEGFSRLFASARRRYESLGRVGGTIRLSQLRMNERTKLSGLLSRSLMKQNSVTVQMQELENILLSSRFEIDLQSLLAVLYGEEIKSKAEQTVEAEETWRRFVDQLRGVAIETETTQWLEGLYSAEGYGYRTFHDLFEQIRENPQHRDDLETDVTAVIQAIDHLPVREGELQPLAVFAAVQCWDPHFFDRDRIWGRLFYYGILAYLAYHGIYEDHPPLSDETQKDHDNLIPMDSNEKTTSDVIRKQYEQAGIRLDSLSSQVLVVDVDAHLQACSYWLTLDTIERFQQRWQGLAGEHADTENRDIDSITAFVKRVFAAGEIFVNENPAVCEAMMSDLVRREKVVPDKHPVPFICTSGQPSVAALKLLDFFAAHEVEIYYSGDLDVKGLEMAIALNRRYPSLWHPWGMTSAIVRNTFRTTEQRQTGVCFSEAERTRLQNLSCQWDPHLIEELLNGGRKIYQEMLIPELIREYRLV